MTAIDHQPADFGAYKTKIRPDLHLWMELERDLVFTAHTRRGYEIEFDAEVEWGCMPTEALIAATVGCMAIDVVSFLRKMRSTIVDFRIDVVGHRKPSPPQYLHGMELQITIKGANIDDKKMTRAVELSKNKYCSVCHTLRPDLEHQVSWQIEEARDAATRTTKTILVPGDRA